MNTTTNRSNNTHNYNHTTPNYLPKSNIHQEYPKSINNKNRIICNNPFDRYNNMMQQASWVIRNMIENLVNIYKNYKVRFSVAHYQHTIVRLLTPVEIKGVLDSSQVGFIIENKKDVNQLLNQNGSSRNTTDNYQPINYQPQKQNPISRSKQKINDQRNRNTQNMKKPIQDRLKYQQHSQNYNQQQHKYNFQNNKQRNDDIYKTNKLEDDRQIYNSVKITNDVHNRHTVSYIKKPGVRSRGLQGLLCNWILQQNQRGQIVSRMDVLNKVKHIGKGSNLKGSAGWYSNFIRRNPQIRKILSKGNAARARRNMSHNQQQYPQINNKYNQYQHYQQKQKQDDEIDQQQQQYQNIQNIYDEEDNSMEDNIAKIQKNSNNQQQQQQQQQQYDGYQYDKINKLGDKQINRDTGQKRRINNDNNLK